MATMEEAPPMLTLDDFDEEQKQYVGQLAKLSSRSAAVIEPARLGGGKMTRVQVDPVLAAEFVEQAKAIKQKQNSLMRQIISLSSLFEMSVASLTKMLAGLS